MGELCHREGCGRKAAPRSPWCHSCLRRRRNGKPMETPVRAYRRPPKELFQEAVRAYADAEDVEHAWHRLRVAAARWFKARGWRPPTQPDNTD